MRLARTFLPLLVLGLAGCVNYAAVRAARLDALIGYTEPQLVQALGVPSRSFTTNGQTYLAYDQANTEVIPGSGGFGYGWGYGYGWGGGFGAFPPVAITRSCQTAFRIDAGRVAAWTLHGDGCF